VACSRHRSPSPGGASARVVAARSRVTIPSTRSTRRSTCQPSATGRGSSTTRASMVASPPWAASAGRSPCDSVSTRRPAAAPTMVSTASTAAAPRGQGPGWCQLAAPSIRSPSCHRAGAARARPPTAAPSATRPAAPTSTRARAPTPAWAARSPTTAPSTPVSAQTGSGPRTSAVQGRSSASSGSPAASGARRRPSGPLTTR
jgi:hypothetical protein